ncbi:methyltransferase, partial [Vibrio vulnificus]|uniref:methyltransferase n=1 Tax=Vibrio vulnificus TaxID=672 RepID=UPI001EEC3861
MKTELNLFDRQLTLFRYPNNANETLQAWDAGDEYLINYVEELALDTPQNILILNDHFGALSCWFSAQHQVTMMSDSFISQQGAKENLQRNQCREVKLLTTLDAIPTETSLVLFQLPKNNRHLTWQLTKLRKTLSPDVPVVAVNKAKEIHTSTLKLFEKYLGTTKTSLAWKKHRLVFCQADCTQMNDISPVTRWNVEEHKMTLNNLPNVYSGESLDLGARFMLEHIPQDESLKHIIDLGCGNGVLSPKAALNSHNPTSLELQEALVHVKHSVPPPPPP